MGTSKQNVLVDIAVTDRGVAVEFAKIARSVEQFSQSLKSIDVNGNVLTQTMDQFKQLARAADKARGKNTTYDYIAKQYRNQAQAQSEIVGDIRKQDAAWLSVTNTLKEQEAELDRLLKKYQALYNTSSAKTGKPQRKDAKALALIDADIKKAEAAVAQSKSARSAIEAQFTSSPGGISQAARSIVGFEDNLQSIASAAINFRNTMQSITFDKSFSGSLQKALSTARKLAAEEAKLFNLRATATTQNPLAKEINAALKNIKDLQDSLDNIPMEQFEKRLLDAKSAAASFAYILETTASTGKFSGNVKDIIRVTEEYIAAEQKLKDLRSQRTKANPLTQEIAQAKAELKALGQELDTLTMKKSNKASSGLAKSAARSFVTKNAEVSAMTAERQARTNVRTAAIDARDYAQKQAAHQERINILRSKDTIERESQVQEAKKLLSLEAQIQQAISGEVAERRAVSEAMKKMQDFAVKKGSDALIMNYATKFQKLGLVLKSVGQIWTKNNLFIGSAGRSLIQNSAVTTVTTGKYVKLGNAIGIGIVAFGKIASVAGRAARSLINVGRAIAGQLVNGMKLAAQAGISLIGVLAKVAAATGRTIKSIGSSAVGWIKARREQKKYADQTGETVDAEGWHSRSLKGLVGNAVSLNRWINTLGSGVRQLGQAFQNTGTTMSIFISYPMGNFLKQGWQAAVDFDSALIEIKKNADLTTKELKVMKNELLTLSLGTPTAVKDLGSIASSAAKLGIPTQNIGEFTRVIDQLVVSSDIAAEDAGDNIARLMNIFFDLGSEALKDGKTFAKVANGIGSAINELGKNSPVGEGEIVSSALRLAPSARAMNLSLQDTLALAASVTSASASAERAGTQAATALTQMAVKVSKLSGMSETTEDQWKQLWKENPTEMFLSIADAIGNIEDPIERTNMAFELFGSIGGKAMNILGSSTEFAAQNVQIARDAFEQGTSLSSEFSQAMNGVENQVGLLKNQFSYMAIVLADAVLPMFTKVMSYAIPAVQGLARYFATLSDKTKLWIVGIATATAVLGPLLYMIGSIMFSIGIMITGVTSLASVFGKLVSIPLTIVGALMSLIPTFGFLVTAIGLTIAAVIGFNMSILDLSNTIFAFFSGVFGWFRGILSDIGKGISSAIENIKTSFKSVVKGMSTALDELADIGGGLGDELGKKGADAGKKFGESFSQGIKDALSNLGIDAELEALIRSLSTDSFNMFSEMSSVLESIVQTGMSAIGADQETTFNAINGALKEFAQIMVAIQNGVSNLGDLFSGLTEYTGPFADDFQRLVGLQLDYNEATKQLKTITQELENLDKVTSDTIKKIASRTDLTVAERIALIRTAKIEADQRQTQLEEEQKAAEQRQEELQKELDYRKQLIALLERLVPPSDQAQEVSLNATDSFGKIGDMFSNLKGLSAEALGDMGVDFEGFNEKVAKARDSIQGFFDAIMINPAKQGASEDYLTGYMKGDEARNKYLNWIGDVKTGWENVTKAFQTFTELMTIFQLAITDSDNKTLSELVGKHGRTGEAFKSAGDAIDSIIDKLNEYSNVVRSVFYDSVDAKGNTLWDLIIKKADEFMQKFVMAYNSNSPEIFSNPEAIASPLGAIAIALGKIAGLAFNNLPVLGSVLGAVASMATSLYGVAGSIAAIVASLLGVSDKDILEPLTQSLGLIGDGTLAEQIMDKINTKGGEKSTLGQQILGAILVSIEQTDWWRIGKSLANRINEVLFGSVDAKGVQSFGILSSIPFEQIGDTIAWVFDVIGGFISTLDGQKLGNTVAQLINTILTPITPDRMAPVAENIIGAIASALANLDFDKVAGAATAVINALIKGLQVGVTDEQFKTNVRSFAGNFIRALASVDWSSLVFSIGTFMTELLGGLAGADWKSLRVALTSLITALVSALTNPELWSGLGATLGGLASAIALGIATADWGSLFSVSNMKKMADAFIMGFFGALFAPDNATQEELGAELDNEQAKRASELYALRQNRLLQLRQQYMDNNNSIENYNPEDHNSMLDAFLQMLDMFTGTSYTQPAQQGDPFALVGEGPRQGDQDGYGSGTGVANSDRMFDALLSLFFDWSGRNRTKMESGGGDIAKNILNGISDTFYSEAASMAFNAMLSTFGLWITNTKDVAALGGSIIASNIYDGAKTLFAESTEAFDEIIDTLNKWVTGKYGSIKLAGIRIGTAIAEGISLGIKTSNSIESAIGSIVSGVAYTDPSKLSYGPAAISIGQRIAERINTGIAATGLQSGITTSLQEIINKLNEIPYAPPPFTASAGMSSAQVAPVSNITININGTFNVDNERRINELADAVTRKIGREMKLRGAF